MIVELVRPEIRVPVENGKEHRFAAVLSAPIAAYVFGGVTGAGTDAVVAAFRAFGLDALGANLAQGSVSEPIDKIVTYLVVWAIMLGLPQRFKGRFASE